MPKQKSKTKSPLTARTADKFALYREAVQAPDADTAFLARHFRKEVGRPARSFREDFCGTAALSCHWVRLHRENTALGIDLDAPTLAWGREHNVATLLDAEQQTRLTLRRADVLAVRRPKVDIVCALNFSYCVFKTRPQMQRYFDNCRRSVVDDGMLFIDLWGGSAAQTEQVDRRRCKGFTYLWDQAKFDPLSYETTCKIHFEFRDGTRMRNAFVYDWRLWTAPELREMVTAAGFKQIYFLWEGTTANGAGNGVYRKVERGDADRSWISYLVARP